MLRSAADVSQRSSVSCGRSVPTMGVLLGRSMMEMLLGRSTPTKIIIVTSISVHIEDMNLTIFAHLLCKT